MGKQTAHWCGWERRVSAGCCQLGLGCPVASHRCQPPGVLLRAGCLPVGPPPRSACRNRSRRSRRSRAVP